MQKEFLKKKKKKSKEENQELSQVQKEKKRENFFKRCLSFGKNDAGELKEDTG